MPITEPHIREAATRLGETLFELTPEASAYEVGRLYMALLPDDYRSRFGVYYTPPALAARLLDTVESEDADWTAGSVLDPACGGGAFLVPVALRMMRALSGNRAELVLSSIGERLRGFEIDPFTAWLSQVAVDIAVLPLSARTNTRLPLVVSVCDSLAADTPPRTFDVIVGNPPYGRVSVDATMRKRFARSLYGHANLYGLFTDLAIRYAEPNSLIAYITPTSFLSGQYFKSLRNLLANTAPPISIDFVPARDGIFDDVLQEVLIAVYRAGSTNNLVHINECVPKVPGTISCQGLGSFHLPKDPSEPWLFPRTSSQVALVRRLSSLTARLADWGYAVSTGPLVWNRHKPQLEYSAGPGSLPIVWAESISPDGRFCWKAEKRNHKPYFRYREGDAALITRVPCVLLQRTTSKEQARRLIAAELPESFVKTHGAVVVENHLNIIAGSRDDPPVSRRALVAFLNSSAADHVFRCISGSVAVSAYELEAMPLPPVEAMTIIDRLLDSGAAPTTIDAACRHLIVDAHTS